MIVWYLEGERIEETDIKKSICNRKIILFGADIERNKKLFEEFDKNNIICIFDNDEKKWGKLQNGIMIEEPSNKIRDAVFVSGIYDWKSISHQIRQMGYQQIYFFLTEDIDRRVGKYISKFSPKVYDNKICFSKKFKYIHFIPDEKFFASVIEFIEFGLEIKEHFFVVYGINNGNCNDLYGIWDKYKELSNLYHNIYLLPNESYRFNMDDWNYNKHKLSRLIEEAGKLIFHGEFLTQSICEYLQNKIDLISEKGVFIPWGGDVGRSSFSTVYIDKVLQYARVIPYSFPIDKEIMTNYFPYTKNAIWLKNRVSYARLTKYVSGKKGKIKSILIAHSAHDYTKAIETLHYLADIKQVVFVICLTSYGSQDIAEEIESYGKKYFGDYFISIRSYMNYKEYVSFLSQIDMAIFGMEVLAGRDTLELLFWLGTKVYLKPGSEASDRIMNIGYKVNDYYTAKKDIIERKFCNQDKDWNHIIATDEFDSNKKLEQWRSLYEFEFDS